MVAKEAAQLDTNPTEEFNQQCLQVMQSWESGQLPFREAIARLNFYCQEAVSTGHIANQGRAEQLLGNIQHFAGNLETSIRHWQRARKLYDQVNNRDRVASMDMNIGEGYRFQGDLATALKLYRTAGKIAAEYGNIRAQTLATVNEGLALTAMGRLDEAQEAFEKGMQLAQDDYWKQDPERSTWRSLRCEIHHGKATIYLQQDQLDAAWQEALQALELAEAEGQPMHRGYAYRTAGEVISRLGKSPDLRWPGDPDELFRLSLEAFREIDAEAEVARTNFAHALSLAHQGRRTSAARKLQQVIIVFNRLGMADDAARANEVQLRLN